MSHGVHSAGGLRQPPGRSPNAGGNIAGGNIAQRDFRSQGPQCRRALRGTREDAHCGTLLQKALGQPVSYEPCRSRDQYLHDESTQLEADR